MSTADFMTCSSLASSLFLFCWLFKREVVYQHYSKYHWSYHMRKSVLGPKSHRCLRVTQQHCDNFCSRLLKQKSLNAKRIKRKYSEVIKSEVSLQHVVFMQFIAKWNNISGIRMCFTTSSVPPLIFLFQNTTWVGQKK